jgi:primosomal protein N' (replication factor Y)
VDADGLSSRLRTVAAALPDQWTSVATVVDSLQTTRASLAKLQSLGIAQLDERHVDELIASAGSGAEAVDPSSDSTAPVAAGEAPHELTDEQRAALAACEAASASLLMGVTGSGKTEVYLQLIARELEAGRGAIVLVPEIALTPQTAGRFLRRFPGRVEVLHSNLTRAQRAAAWERIASGSAPVVVGPRSAVFAPVPRLGVVVVDEEHDSSYKQDSEPRYDARRVAWKRALLEDARVVFGSATPRPESYHGMSERVRMRTRASGAGLAPVELVDLRAHGDGYPLSEHTRAALDACVQRGRKAIVLHNRRGYATALHCRSCGHTWRCQLCDVSLVVHGHDARSQRLACHHCGFRTQLPHRCTHCGAADVARMGAGTERIEADLAQQFAVPVLRLDADTARRGGGVGAVLAQFSRPGPGILTGTQMVAKGHDFADVELAVVVDADAGLAIPDFRAEERAFALVAQLAGRAGRSLHTAREARVIVQTWDTDNEWIRFATHHDVEGFLDYEIARRRHLGYPPFSRIVRVLVSAPERGSAETWANAAADGLRALEAGPVRGPAQLLRIAGRERAQVIVRTANAPAVADAVRRFIRSSEPARARGDVRLLLDVDPQALV